jgi:phage N-6-adenine-methyltransferase
MAFFKNKFDSIKQDWNTPKVLFDKLNKEFNFKWDLAASKENTLCKNYYTKETDGLKQNWIGVCWCNPPYGDKNSKMVDWIKKAYLDTYNRLDLTVVMLIPARTNTKWFHNYCMKADEVRFICGRPKFGDSKHGLPQPLAIIVFKYKLYRNTRFSSFYLY